MCEVVKYRTKLSYFFGKCKVTNTSSYLCEPFFNKRPHPNPPLPALCSYWHKLEEWKKAEKAEPAQKKMKQAKKQKQKKQNKTTQTNQKNKH